ncbi:MAG TPA: beta-ketoacyl-ACP synthase 3, partial [Thermoleophilaceae bacterium]|nr:beta-ketoacyl-ACP synthase 3 [Thermoleophilaceae bacterium]
MHWPVEVEAPQRATTRILRRAGIVGLGAALPPAVIESDTIASRLGLESGWIQRRTGIRERRRAAADARVADLAADAARAALNDAQLDAAAVDTVLVATLAPDELTPNAAPQVAHAIGATGAAAMDIGAACTGFVSGLTLGSALIEAHRARNVLVIGAEILSRFTNPDDRSTAGLFGDGAGAVVLTPRQESVVGSAVLGSDGVAAPFIIAPRESGFITMDGHETFKRAVATLASNAVQTAAANGLELDDIDLFVLHQANGRILSAVRETLRLAPERVLDVIANVGNTSAASIPLALAEARERGALPDGARVLLGAVGAG